MTDSRVVTGSPMAEDGPNAAAVRRRVASRLGRRTNEKCPRDARVDSRRRCRPRRCPVWSPALPHQSSSPLQSLTDHPVRRIRGPKPRGTDRPRLPIEAVATGALLTERPSVRTHANAMPAGRRASPGGRSTAFRRGHYCSGFDRAMFVMRAAGHCRRASDTKPIPPPCGAGTGS